MLRTAAQQRAENFEQLLVVKYNRFFRGVARIRLDSLAFSNPDPISQQNLRRLCRIFKNFRCLHQLPEHRILVLLSERQFDAALAILRITPEQFQTPLENHEYELVSPLAEPFRCLHGKHRVEAGRQVLQPSDQWWSANVLVSDGQFPLRDRLPWFC